MKIDVNSPKMQKLLASVIQPVRYCGGEPGSIEKSEKEFITALCFPDLYEIGMSNQAIHILYEKLNQIEGLSCERVFAPAPDFKDILAENNIPLYTLEGGTPLNETDLIAFTLGTELAATTLLAILNSGGVPVLRKNRSEKDPIILMGGPASTNPHPFSDFVDAVFVGEFEQEGERFFLELTNLKKKGASRKELLQRCEETPCIWTPAIANTKKIIRAIWQDFSLNRQMDKTPLIPWFSVQDHGVIEIMRGCPNNCRFCHAGIYYNPCREKSVEQIIEEADFLVNKAGYRDLTLSSLSTGDYSNLDPLTQLLTNRFKNEALSLSLPSLRVNSLTMNLLENLGSGKKSGLTFAVETADPNWQKSLNKEVHIERVVSVLEEAVSRGWRLAKFYFMIGLPVSIEEDEGAAIIAFIKELKSRVQIRMNINIGTFIPKAHTAFQWSAQMSMKKSGERLRRIKEDLKKLQVKVSYHEPKLSWIEGIISRGNKETGELIYRAWKEGAYLDAWNEYFKDEIWDRLLSEYKQTQIQPILEGFNREEPLVWDDISLRSSKKFLLDEYKAAMECRMTSTCEPECELNCGLCGKKNQINQDKPLQIGSERYQTLLKKCQEKAHEQLPKEESQIGRMVLSYSKKSKAVWIPHRAMTALFEKLFVTSSMVLSWSQGFNPKPRMEFASPLPVGAEGEEEWVLVEVHYTLHNLEQQQAYIQNIIDELNHHGIKGITFYEGKLFPHIPNHKKIKLMPLVKEMQYEIQYPLESKQEIDCLLDSYESTLLSQKVEDRIVQVIEIPAGKPNLFKAIVAIDPDRKISIKRVKVLGF